MYFNFFKREETKDGEFLSELRNAYIDLKNAELFFENANDPDLIDYAVFRLEAAKARYSFFLKKAKEEGISSDIVYNV